MTGNDTHDFFVQSARDGSVEFRIAATLLRAISVEVMRGFGMTRRRGAEVGGLLVGSEANGILTISDFEIVPCEYAHGPSWLLSDDDTSKFAAAMARWRRGRGSRTWAVGWFRSHTRPGLGPDPSDLHVFQRHFSGSQAALLLIKPYASRNAEAALYLLDSSRTSADAALEFEFGPAGAAVVSPATEPPDAANRISRHGTVDNESVPGAIHPPAGASPGNHTVKSGETSGAGVSRRILSGPEPSAGAPVSPVPVPPESPGRPVHEAPPQKSEDFPTFQVVTSADVPAAAPVEEWPAAEPVPEPAVDTPPAPQEPDSEPSPDSRPVSSLRLITEKERLLHDVLGPREPQEHAGTRTLLYHRDLFADYATAQSRWFGHSAWWTAALLSALLFGFAIGYRQAGRSLADLRRSSAATDAFGLGLTTSLRGESILIQWDRRATAIEKGLRGTAIVSSAGGRQEIRLEPTELRNGVLLYKTDAAEANIRLEVFLTPDRLVAEQTVWKRTGALQK